LVKILYLLDCTGDAGGGAERLAVSVLTSLDPQGYDRYLCLSRSSEGYLVEQAKAAGVKVFQLKRRSRYDLLPWLRLVRLMRREKIEILHTHKHGSNFWGAIISLATGVPVFLAHEHSWQYSGSRARILIDRFLIARRATKMIAVSAPDREAMISVEHISPSKIVVVQNGITFDAPPDVEAVRHELRLPSGSLVVACVGVRAEKRVDLVLRALDLLRDTQPDLQLLVVGDYQSELAGLGEIADSLRLSDRVRFLGERHDVPSLLAVSDLAVLASDREGAPLAILEYMAAGCAIVASRVGGIPNMIEDGVEGLLVEPGDPELLARGIGQLAGSPTRRAELGRAARERQARDFSLNAVVRQTVELYDESLGRPGFTGVQPSVQVS
jgi:glycosyltransferase involved in cell wall biosynthesis